MLSTLGMDIGDFVFDKMQRGNALRSLAEFEEVGYEEIIAV